MANEIEAYPLCWPAGWKKTESYRRETSRFRIASFAVARDELFRELQRMYAKKVILSTNIELRQDGIPYANRRQPSDPGVAVYFNKSKRQQDGSWKDIQMVFACDRWRKVEENIQAIRHTINAVRGIARWGASEAMERAFTGFVALPSGTQWWTVFKFDSPRGVTAKELKDRYKYLAFERHPDRGGSDALMAELNMAYKKGQAEVGIDFQ